MINAEQKEEARVTPHDTRYLFVLPFSTAPAVARRFLARDSQMVGNIRFGKVLETLDKVAENTALAYVHRFYPTARVVTAAIDNIVIRNPADTIPSRSVNLLKIASQDILGGYFFVNRQGCWLAHLNVTSTF